MNILTYFWLKFVLIFKVDFSWSKSSHFQESWKMDRKICNFLYFLHWQCKFFSPNLHWQCKFFIFFALASQIFKIFALAMQVFYISCIDLTSFFPNLHWQCKFFIFFVLVWWVLFPQFALAKFWNFQKFTFC